MEFAWEDGNDISADALHWEAQMSKLFSMVLGDEGRKQMIKTKMTER